MAQIGSLRFVDASFAEIERLCRMNPRHDHARPLRFRQRLDQFHFPVTVDPFDRLNHEFSIPRRPRPSPGVDPSPIWLRVAPQGKSRSEAVPRHSEIANLLSI